MQFEYHQYAYNSDNYGVLIHDPASGQTASVDAGDAKATLGALAEKEWTLNELWITHHHWDHTDGLEALKAATGCLVRGPEEKIKPIAGLDQHLSDGANFVFAGQRVEVIATPGHTLDMINFYLPDEGVVFAGDTLFVLGCGRIFEGTPEQMFKSLHRLATLPGQTTVYCSHEYTLANAQFALALEPENTILLGRAKQLTAMREDGLATVPTTIAAELETNPFLRAGSPEIRARIDMICESDHAVFAKIRALKNNA